MAQSKVYLYYLPSSVALPTPTPLLSLTSQLSTHTHSHFIVATQVCVSGPARARLNVHS